MDKVTVRILFFAKSRELAGRSEAIIEVNKVIRGQQLLNILCELYQLTAIKDNLILALNSDYCDDLNVVLTLNSNDEIAIIPPISGG